MKFKTKFLIAPVLAAAVTIAPMNNAEAYYHGHHGGGHGGRGFGVGAAVGGLLVGAALLATAPFRAIGEAVEQPVAYEPYQPQPQYYAPRPVYTREYVEAPPTYYYAPAPRYYQRGYGGGYYAPAAAYYPY